ncbi:hypothetical protein VPH35_117757 [Triticum aestivum]
MDCAAAPLNDHGRRSLPHPPSLHPASTLCRLHRKPSLSLDLSLGPVRGGGCFQSRGGDMAGRGNSGEANYLSVPTLCSSSSIEHHVCGYCHTRRSPLLQRSCCSPPHIGPPWRRSTRRKLCSGSKFGCSKSATRQVQFNVLHSAQYNATLDGAIKHFEFM